MPERGQWQASWIPLAAKFPVSLSTDIAPEAVPDGKSLDAFGIGIDKPELLYTDAAPSAGAIWNGTLNTVSSPTGSPLTGTAVWQFAANRLWAYQVTTNRVTYGASGYDSNYILDGLGYINCDFETSNITALIPFGDSIAVFKSTCLYVIRNANGFGGSLVSEYVKQASGLATAANAIVIDSVLFWVNTLGVWSYDGQQITELTTAVRGSLAPFTSATVTSLRADFEKRRLIGRASNATKFIIALGQSPDLYNYSTAGFRFTSRTLVGAEGEPMLADKISFICQYSVDEMATINIDVKINDEWKSETQKKFRPADDNGRCEIQLSNVLACRKFAMRIINMSSGLYISEILVHAKQSGVSGYSNK